MISNSLCLACCLFKIKPFHSSLPIEEGSEFKYMAPTEINHMLLFGQQITCMVYLVTITMSALSKGCLTIQGCVSQRNHLQTTAPTHTHKHTYARTHTHPGTAALTAASSQLEATAGNSRMWVEIARGGYPGESWSALPLTFFKSNCTCVSSQDRDCVSLGFLAFSVF